MPLLEREYRAKQLASSSGVTAGFCSAAGGGQIANAVMFMAENLYMPKVLPSAWCFSNDSAPVYKVLQYRYLDIQPVFLTV